MKVIIYQTLVRLFGNNTKKCVPNGTIGQNGCGKMNDFTTEVLNDIRAMGATHIWYTGLLEHATQTDYSAFGIRKDHPAVVKGKAGSPYAVKDYYDIDPDLAVDVKQRRSEFKKLVSRTHKAGLKLIIDFIPNHLARQYHSDVPRTGGQDFGANDNTAHSFDAQNNFYYIGQEPLHTDFVQTPQTEPYTEQPAKATGNDRFDAYPSVNDWYETVKLNYGVDYCGGRVQHFSPIPDTWHKMLHILLYWSAKGVDAFRCDMAEMVPCEFWQWAIAEVKKAYPNVEFIAEIYNPDSYRDYLFRGGFDYLYDKVGLYDTLRAVVCGHLSASAITGAWQQVSDISHRMLNFLENHDEQRIASDFFAADAEKGKPALVVSACLNTAPFMLYAGQELGERGMDEEGFSGRDGRTTIFDYWCVNTLRRWLFDKKLTAKEKALQAYYTKLLTLCNQESALCKGQFFDLMYANYDNPKDFDFNRLFAFIRKYERTMLLIVCNFGETKEKAEVCIPAHAFDFLEIPEGAFTGKDLLSETTKVYELRRDKKLTISVKANDAVMLKFEL